MDPKFHCYLPQSGDGNMAVENEPTADEPELQLITDAILAKSSSEQLLEVI